MAVTSTPIFSQAPKNKTAAITAAQTDQTGATTTNLVTLLTAGANGSKVLRIDVLVPVTSVASVVTVFDDDAGNGTFRPIYQFEIPARTVSNTAKAYYASLPLDDCILTAGTVLKVGMTVANNPTVVNAWYGDY